MSASCELAEAGGEIGDKIVPGSLAEAWARDKDKPERGRADGAMEADKLAQAAFGAVAGDGAAEVFFAGDDGGAE